MEQITRRLWGQDFPLVSEGLSESAVVAFVNKLIEERESLARGQESLVYLRQLAEKMVIEAGEMAATIKKEAEAEANALTDLARSRADTIAGEVARMMSETTVRADEIMRKAQEEADQIKAQTSQELEREIGIIWGKFCHQLGTLERRVMQELWDELNNLFQSIKRLGTKYQGKWIDDVEELVAKRLEPAKTPEGTSIDTTDTTVTTEAMPIQFRDHDKNNVLSLEGGPTDKCQNLEPGLSANVVDTQESPKASELQCYEGEIDILVAQPVNAVKLLRLTKELEGNPGIIIRNVVNSSSGPCVISLLLKRPVALGVVLKSIAGVTVCDTLGIGTQSGQAKINIQLAR